MKIFSKVINYLIIFFLLILLAQIINMFGRFEIMPSYFMSSELWFGFFMFGPMIALITLILLRLFVPNKPELLNTDVVSVPKRSIILTASLLILSLAVHGVYFAFSAFGCGFSSNTGCLWIMLLDIFGLVISLFAAMPLSRPGLLKGEKVLKLFLYILANSLVIIVWLLVYVLELNLF